MDLCKKIIALMLVLVMVLSLGACGSKNEDDITDPNEEKTPDVVLVTDVTGLGGGGFNDLCWAGVQEACDEFDLGYYCMETREGETYATVLENACALSPMLIICAGSDMADALKTIASQKPEMKFAIMNASDLGDNVTGVTFSMQDVAFLSGIVAGLKTESKIVSFIGSKETKEQAKYQYAFSAGVLSVASDTYVNSQYIGSYTDTETAKTIAGAHTALGSDVIFHAAGSCGQTIIEQCQSKGAMVIGCGIDQSELAPETVLCSAVRCPDVAIYDVVKRLSEGTLDGSDIACGMEEGGIALVDGSGNVPAEIMEVVSEYEAKIADGTLIVPVDWQTYSDYSTALAQ